MTLSWMFSELEHRRGRGGGGKLRIRLGRTGPRGRMYSSARTPRSGGTCIVKATYVRTSKDSGRHIGAHLRYVEERERGEKEKERDFFDRERNGIERKEVERAMLDNRGERVSMHKLILSPGDNGVDIRDYTRESMERLEERLGHKLDWYGVIHENTDHHHAHVVIAGKIPGREREIERREAAQYAHDLDYAIEREIADSKTDRLPDWLLFFRDLASRPEDREPIDPRDLDVVPKREMSPEEVRVNKMLDRYEREMAAHEAATKRGDVYLDKRDLQGLRYAGNDYLDRERSLDRELERAMERELGRDYTPEHERVRGLDWQRQQWDFDRFSTDRERGEPELNRSWETFESDRQTKGQEQERGGDDDEERRGRGRELDRGNDLGR